MNEWRDPPQHSSRHSCARASFFSAAVARTLLATQGYFYAPTRKWSESVSQCCFFFQAEAVRAQRRRLFIQSHSWLWVTVYFVCFVLEFALVLSCVTVITMRTIILPSAPIPLGSLERMKWTKPSKEEMDFRLPVLTWQNFISALWCGEYQCPEKTLRGRGS